MATAITDRAVKVAHGIITANSTIYTVYADYQVGARVSAAYPNRYWLVLATPERRIVQSTQKRSLYTEWMELIAANGTPA